MAGRQSSAVVAALLAYQWLVNRGELRGVRYVAANLTATAAIAAYARRHRIELGQFGGPPAIRAGAAVGGAAGVLFAALLATPSGRRALRDQRIAGLSGVGVACEVLGRIPLGTVTLEEAAFRGLLAEVGSDALACAVFGIWHIPPTLRTLDANGVTSPPARAAAVSAAVAATTLAGALFCRLRRRYGLAAPVTAHATVNGLGTIAAAAAHRLP